jgi:fatty acid desaturase
MTTAFDDYSAGFPKLRRNLLNSRGISYLAFLKTLRPDYRQVRRDIALGYGMIAATLLLAAVAPSFGVPPLLVVVLAAVAIGYWIAYLQLFLHEGAHFNLASDRDASDRFCDLTISWMIGTSVAAYRKVHFHHHRALGTTDDSEHTYFFPLNVMFVIKALFGIRALEVIISRMAIGKKKVSEPAGRQRDFSRPSKKWIILLGPLVHGGIVVTSALSGYWWVSIAWLAGLGTAFPFFGALRQLLEHRGENAEPRTDYFAVNHGAVTRIFEDGPIGSTFGGAGFNRHLIHHWEPQISYTNLREVQDFLSDTAVGNAIMIRKTTYFDAFLRLLSR